jgi:carbon monoxide dehydrogenase subunit G
MKVTGTATLSADRSAVWRALNDPAVLQRTIPGCQSLEALGEDTYAMRVAAGVGSIKGVYDGQVRLSDQEEPGSFRLHAQGAGAPGTIGADVLVTLEEAPGGGTALSYDADATVGGMIGGVGQRMLVGVSKKMAGQFFANVDAAMTGTGAPAGAPATEGAGMPTVYRDAVPGRAPSGRSGFAAGVAVGAAAALAGALVGAWIAGRRR